MKVWNTVIIALVFLGLLLLVSKLNGFENAVLMGISILIAFAILK